MLLSSAAEDGWVGVPRTEHVAHQLVDEDPSVWVVFAKTFGAERILVRFPQDPAYRSVDGGFEVYASHAGQEEISLIIRKNSAMTVSLGQPHEIVYYDADTGRWVFERHVETAENRYVLRVSHPSQSRSLFMQFSDSFEIE